ncbi:MAG: glycerol-3-phosphate dehydrogenase/oxidase [Myxococcota bacterium]|nr:glycerol-3-phosphate dehydrogenase/oxidase [Myxococcota bacterium]
MSPHPRDQQWDLIVIGGGVTGAGVLKEAVRMGLKTLLVEQRDFAWGTSSRSSKLVHGGLRYLKQGKFGLTRESVVHRERLVREAPGLVTPISFYVPIYQTGNVGQGRWLLKLGLSIYDVMAWKLQHAFLKPDVLLQAVPGLRREGLIGGYLYGDAQVDDARLVLRLIKDAVRAGGAALSYTAAEKIVRDAGSGRVIGLIVRDVETSETTEIKANTIINVSGTWAETLHPSPDPGRHLRPLRGSHIYLPAQALTLPGAVSISHPDDRRPVYAIPWEGGILVGTTDLDYKEDLNTSPRATTEEVDYLMKAVTHYFPTASLSLADCISSQAGLRPVLSKGDVDPSKESREHVVWADKGLVTLTGGKLTTFRALAWDALTAAFPKRRKSIAAIKKEPVFSPIKEASAVDGLLTEDMVKRLYGRYGDDALDLIQNAPKGSLEVIPGTKTVWAELPYAARTEWIQHLTDLLLRRVRFGLLLPEGGRAWLDKVESLCAPHLDWDGVRWKAEKTAYIEEWDATYSLPVGSSGS